MADTDRDRHHVAGTGGHPALESTRGQRQAAVGMGGQQQVLGTFINHLAQSGHGHHRTTEH